MSDSQSTDVLFCLEQWLARSEAQDRFRVAKHKDHLRVAKEKLALDWRELRFRFCHPVKAIQTWWRHKAPRRTLLHLLHQADQLSAQA